MKTNTQLKNNVQRQMEKINKENRWCINYLFFKMIYNVRNCYVYYIIIFWFKRIKMWTQWLVSPDDGPTSTLRYNLVMVLIWILWLLVLFCDTSTSWMTREINFNPTLHSMPTKQTLQKPMCVFLNSPTFYVFNSVLY